jgi:hypothetical protein
VTMNKEKRAFLAQHLGEEETARLENALEELQEELQRRGVRWKDIEGVAVAASLATSFEQHEQDCEFREQSAALIGILTNIQVSTELPIQERRRLAAQAAEDYLDRLHGLGIAADTKESKRRECCRPEPSHKGKRILKPQGHKEAADSPAAPFIDLLAGNRPLTSAAKVKVKELGASSDPAAAYVADLVRGGAVPG